jgi:segregation and condensation protein A
MTSSMAISPDISSKSFQVDLEEFSGPFDLLLSLIAKHKLEVTELALSQVTDDFLKYLKEKGNVLDLEEISSFLVVAATLLDLKAARLIPSGEVEDEEDIAMLEARDLLFARLLQYRAYKQVSQVLKDMMEIAPRRWARTTGFDPELNQLLPEVTINLTASQFAALAVSSLLPRELSEISTAHLHAPLVSVSEQMLVVADRLRNQHSLSFRELIADSPSIGHVVARFLALLELIRQQLVSFEQVNPLDALTLIWQGGDVAPLVTTSEFDELASEGEGND